jgi:hypothetical protein
VVMGPEVLSTAPTEPGRTTLVASPLSGTAPRQAQRYDQHLTVLPCIAQTKTTSLMIVRSLA